MPEGEDIKFNARWLKAMREHVGWSTGETARAITEMAAQLNDHVRLSQQTVSAFEHGSHKSIPRWLGYAQIAMAKEMLDRQILHDEVWDLRLPGNSARFFESQRLRLGLVRSEDGPPKNATAAVDSQRLTAEEREWLSNFRQMSESNRSAALQLVRSLAKGDGQ